VARPRNSCCGPDFGTSTYFLLALLALVDFLSGIALHARRGAVTASATAVSRKSARKNEKLKRRRPSRNRSRACARACDAGRRLGCESVLLDHPGTSLAQPTAPRLPQARHRRKCRPRVCSPARRACVAGRSAALVFCFDAFSNADKSTQSA